tara:strand:+ start:149 stop:880 length:732 start_codon:yes stop_codon:yes gene_type:complete
MNAESASTRLGMLTPSSNTVLEPLTFDMLANQSKISVHFSRFRVLKISLDSDSLGQFSYDPMLEAADLLADAQVQSICWNGTSSGWLGFENDCTLIAEIEARTGIKACSSILAMNELLTKFNAKRIGFVTPYLNEIQQKILNNYRSEGYEIAGEKHLGDPGNFSFATYSEAEILELCRAVANERPDAILIFCTNFRGARLAPIIEKETGITVLDSVSTALWKSIKVAGEEPKKIRGWGRLFDV